MLLRTEGIVLRTIRHQDNHLIATVYTRDHGRMGFIVRGYRSARGAKSHSYFQPLSVIELVFQKKEGRDLHNVRETRHATMLHAIHTDPVKLSLGLAMLEIVKDTVREEAAPNPALYRFIKDYIVNLDQENQGLIQRFIFTLLHLTQFLGFMPSDLSKDSAAVHFDIPNGQFVAETHQREPVSGILRQFLYADYESCKSIYFDQDQKRHLLTTLFGYYQQHIDGFNYPQTIRVFGEIFG
ncbi:MAG: DNA repair protein RecO [Bacteroidia bacterium]